MEKVQRRALGMVSNLRGRTYFDKLEEVGMISLSARRTRGDMIATYKIMTGKKEINPGLFFELVREGGGPRTRRARGVNNISLVQARLDIRRYSYSQRVVNTWNSLPDSTKGAGTVLEFKIAGLGA